jgi:predicted DCC family thiol-disulfide oxidoreductase YuxK
MNRLVVWYDGSCSLCRREIALMQRLDRDGVIDFVDASPGAPPGCPVDSRTLLRRFHVLENGRILDGAAAFAAMWRVIPGLRWLGRLARFRPVLAVLECLYRGFLRIRPFLQRLVGG